MDTPKKQQFAFNNIQMNMSKSDVEKTLNKPKELHLMNMARSGIRIMMTITIILSW